MRKVLSFVLVLALVLGSFSMAFAATPTDVVGQPSEEAVQVLMGLGVVNGYADGSFKPAGIVTRAEMAKLIVVALGLKDYAVGTSKYPDMAGATWAQGFVNYATGLGVIEGYPDGTFKPSQTVSYDEAAAMIVRALGYTDKSLTGTWPANYVVKAKAYGILDGIKSTVGGANRGDIAEMLYNSLMLQIGYTDVDGVWHANNENAASKAQVIASDNMLDRLGAEFFAADDSDTEHLGIIQGDEDTVINLRPFVGAYADRYLNSDGDIIMVLPVSTFLTGEVNFDVDSDEDSIATITVGDVDYTINHVLSTDTSVDIFDNGLLTDSNDLYAWEDGEDGWYTTLAVEVSGKRITDIHSISDWYYDDAITFDADYAAEIVDDQTLESDNAFVLDDNDKIDLNAFELLGAASLEAIKKDNIVYIFSDADSNIRKIEVGTATVTGKVTKKSLDGEAVTINSTVYDLAYYNADDDVSEAVLSADVKLGSTGTASLDYNGEVFAWDETDATAGNYALVVDAAEAVSLDMDRIKLLTKDGTTTIFNVDSDAYATAVDILSFTDGDLVTYSTDKDGVIDEITIENAVPYTTDAGFLSKSGAVFAGHTVDSAVVVFEVSSLTAPNTSTMDVVSLASVDRDNSITAGVFTPDGGKIEVLIVKSTDTTSVKSNYAVINKVEDAVNADDEDVRFVTGFADGKAFTAYTDTTADASFPDNFDATVEPGFWSLDLDADGVITSATFYAYDHFSTALSDEAITDYEAMDAVDSRDGYIVELNNLYYTVDAAAMIYGFDDDATSNPYSLKTITAVKYGTDATLVQIDDTSEYYDFVISVTNGRTF